MGAYFLSWKNLPDGPVWLTSPHLVPWQEQALVFAKASVPRDPNLIWVLSSGTQSVNELKCVGLRREAFLCSADSVNRHLQSNSMDRWLLAIPDHHVGGFAIHARAHLSGAQVVTLKKWSTAEFVDTVQKEHITLTSLVPTQIHDLVMFKAYSPPSLRAVVVGGGSLSAKLYECARQLGWPLLPSYGLTETASQVATATLQSLEQQMLPALSVLTHAQIELRNGIICIQGDSLSHIVARVSADEKVSIDDPLQSGWLCTEDIGAWRNDELVVLGRRDQVVKILGVLVPLQQVENDLQQIFRDRGVEGRVVVLPLPCEREGHELVLLSDADISFSVIEEMVCLYNQQVIRPHRLSRWGWISDLQQSELKKIKRAELRERLKLNSFDL